MTVRTGPARQLDGGVTDRTRASGDQHDLASERTGRQARRPVLRHGQGAVGGHGRYAEAGADVEARAAGQAYDAVSGQVRVLLRGAGRPLVAGEIDPDAIADGKILDTLPEGVDHARTVLVRRDLGERRRCAIAGAEAGLPVGRVDTRDDDADPDLARSWLGHVAVDEPEDGWIAGLGIDDRFHERGNRRKRRLIPLDRPAR